MIPISQSTFFPSTLKVVTLRKTEMDEAYIGDSTFIHYRYHTHSLRTTKG